MPPGARFWLEHPAEGLILAAWLACLGLWLGLQLAARLRLRGTPRPGQRGGRALLARRVVDLLADLTGLPELVAAWQARRGQGRPQRHVIDRWLGTTGLLGGLGLAPLLALAVAAGGLACVAMLVGGHWLWWLAVGLGPYLLFGGLTWLSGRLGHWFQRVEATAQRGHLRQQLAAIRAVGERLGETAPPTASDWLTLAEGLRERRLTAEAAFLARLRCYDQALLAAPAGFDSAAVAAAERLACRRWLGLPAHGDAAELTALLLPRSTAAAAEAQARLLAAHLAEAAPPAWRERAQPLAYGLLESLAPALDAAASARLWAAAAADDPEQRLRLAERLLAERAAGPAPEPLHAPALWWLVEGPRGLAARAPQKPGLALEPPATRLTWYRETGPDRRPERLAGLDAGAVAERLHSLWSGSSYPEREPLVVRATLEWAADSARSGLDGVGELVPHLAVRGAQSPEAAAALAGLAEGLRRYHGPALLAVLELVGEATARLDPRLAWRPRLALARTWARGQAARAEEELDRLAAELLAQPWSGSVYEVLLGVTEALGLLRTPGAAGRLAELAAELQRRPVQGYLAIEESRAEVLGLVPRSKWLLVGAAAALARRGLPVGWELLDELTPPPEALAEPGAEAWLGLLAAAGGPAALRRLEARAVLLIEAGPEAVSAAAHRGRVGRGLERLAAGQAYGAVMRLAQAAATPSLELLQRPTTPAG